MADIYDVEASFYDLFYDRTDDIPFYLEYASKCGGPILECACGTGRVTIPIAQAGLKITGLDINRRMLAVFRRKLAKEEPPTRRRVRIVRGDMRDFRLDQKFKMAFIPFASFLHNLTVKDQEDTLSRVCDHLEPDGLLLLEVFNPNPDRPSQLLRLDHVKQVKGQTLLCLSSQEFDKPNQSFDATMIYDFVSPNGVVKRRLLQFRLRYIFKDELVGLLERTGYIVQDVFGSIAKVPFVEKSPSIVCVARRG
ncbi:MAG: class I SAM-dependent methyltransferase [Conexivisphaerales archaeon]